MACDFWGIEQYPQAHSAFQTTLDFSAYFFYAECVIKIFALGFDGYWGTPHTPSAPHAPHMLSQAHAPHVASVARMAQTARAPSPVLASPTLFRRCGGGAGDAWSRFDFFLVVSSLADQYAQEWFAAIIPVPPMMMRVLRVLRILRILRLLKGAPQLRNLIMTMVYSFPALVNVFSVLALVRQPLVIPRPLG
jgi:hypothetical protein